VPKGRLFPLSRDELIECAPLVRAARERTLGPIDHPGPSLDILAQQIWRRWRAKECMRTRCSTWCGGGTPYRDVSRKDFDAVVQMLAEGFTTRRGRRARTSTMTG